MVGVKGQCGPYQTVFCALCQSSTALEMNSVFHYCSDGLGKQPLAIVGSPYWMAPEVLRGELYNEKVTLCTARRNAYWSTVQYYNTM